MTDTFQDTEFDEGATEGLDPAIRAQLKRSGDAIKAAAASEARAAAAERELAFTKAGLPEGPLADMFRKSYEGDMDPAQIKAQADEMGITQAAPSTVPNALDPAAGAQDPLAIEMAAKRRAAGATGSGASTGGIQPGSRADYEARIRAVDPKSLTAETQVMEIVREAQSNNPELGIYPSGLDS